MILPYYLGSFGMGGGFGVRNPVVDGGYGSPQHLVSHGFGVRPASVGTAALSRHPAISASGLLTLPVYTGSASLARTHPVLVGVSGAVAEYLGGGGGVVLHVMTGSGSFTVPIYTGSADLARPHPLLQSGATFEVPVYAGDAALSHHPTIAGGGVFATAVYAGRAALSHHPVLAGLGSFAAPVYTGEGVLTHHAALAGDGVQGASYEGRADLSHHAVLASAGTFGGPVYAGTAELVRSRPILDATGTQVANSAGDGVLSVAHALAGTGHYFTTVPIYTATASLTVKHPVLGGDSRHDLFVFRIALPLGDLVFRVDLPMILSAGVEL